jgi:hypothetical protein
MTHSVSRDSWLTEGTVDTSSYFPSSDAQNPAFDFGDLPFIVGQAGPEETLETAIQVASAKPLGSGVGVLLMGVAAIAWEAVAPQCRINLNDCRFARRHLPPNEWPEMYSFSGAGAYKAQPRMPAWVDLAKEPGRPK